MEEIQVKIEPDLHLEHLENDVIVDASEFEVQVKMDKKEIEVKIEPTDPPSQHFQDGVIVATSESLSEFEIKTDMDEIEVKMEPDGFPNLPLQHLTEGVAESSSEFKVFKSPKKEVDEITEYFEMLADSESNCEEIEEKFTPLDPVLFCNPELSSTNTKSAEVSKCSKCPMEFPTNTLLRKHMKVKKCKFICSVCQQRFKSKGQLYLHELYTHSIKKEKPEESNSKIPVAAQVPAVIVKKKQCSKCDLTFTTAFLLQNHEYSAHPIKKKFQCSTCDLKFSSENILQLHEKFTHPKKLDSDVIKTESMSPPLPNLKEKPEGFSDATRVRCLKCNQNFKSKSDVIFHQKLKPECDKYWTCSTCFKSFCSSVGLYNHNRIHPDPFTPKPKQHKDNFKCSKCDQTFKSIRNLCIHETHHGDKYACTLCPAIFATKRYLMAHRRVAHPECPELTGIARYKYKCRMCPQLFTTPEEQNEHEESHGEWPCDFCSAVSETHQALTIHRLNLHPEHEQFKCSKCELYFTSPWSRKAHMKKHESKIRLTIKCYKCDLTFLTLFEQARHKEEFHSQPVPQIISKSKPVKEKLSFRKQIPIPKIKPDPVGSIRCQLCPKVFLSKKSFLNHKIRIHFQNPQVSKGKQKRSDLDEESASRDEDLSTFLSDRTKPIPESVGHIKPKVFVKPDDIKKEFISSQSELEDIILGF